MKNLWQFWKRIKLHSTAASISITIKKKDEEKVFEFLKAKQNLHA
jgi:hypothetical protein